MILNDGPIRDLVWVIGRPHSRMAPLVDELAGSRYEAALRPAGRGWWLLTAAGRDAERRQATDLLLDSDAIVLSGQHVGGGVLLLMHGGAVDEYPLGFAMGQPAKEVPPSFPLMEWAAGRLGGTVRATQESRFWAAALEGPSIREIASDLLMLLGLVDSEEEPWRALGDCRGPVHDLESSNWLGIRRIAEMAPVLTVARGDNFYGLWDWDEPNAPTRRFPMTRDGLQQAFSARYESAIRPLLASMIITGDRSWARVDSGLCVMVIFTNERRGFVVICNDRPSTYSVTDAGRARLSAPAQEAAGCDAPAKDKMVELRSAADMQRFAEFEVSRGQRLNWQDVPDEVPSNVLATNEWVRLAGMDAGVAD